MSISEYFSWLTSSGETSATVGLVLTGIMVVVMLWGLFKGSRRGLFRQILHSIAVAASFIISYMTTTEMIAILDSELANLDMATLAPELVANGVIDEATAGIVMNVDNALVAEIMMLVVTVLLASIVFVLTYIVVSFLASIVYFIISRFIPKHRTAATLIPAMIIGLVEGFVAVSLLFTPIVSVIDLSTDLAEALEEADEGESELAVFIEENVTPHSYSPVINGAKLVGADDIVTSFATVVRNGESVDMRENVNTGVMIYVDVMDLSSVNWQQLSPMDKENINSLLNHATDTDFYRIVTAGLLSSVAVSLSEGNIALEAPEPFGAFVTDVINLFAGCTSDTVISDLTTVKDIYFILSDRGVLLAMTDSTDSITDALTAKNADGDTVINEVIAKLKEGGDRTKTLITTLTKISVSVLADNLGLDEDTAELYENVKDSLNTVLSEIPDKDSFDSPEEYKAEVSSQIDKALANNSIELDDEIIDGIADYYVSSGLDEYEELTDDDINDLILSYYDAYLKYLETGEVPVE